MTKLNADLVNLERAGYLGAPQADDSYVGHSTPQKLQLGQNIADMKCFSPLKQ